MPLVLSDVLIPYVCGDCDSAGGGIAAVPSAGNHKRDNGDECNKPTDDGAPATRGVDG